MLYWWWYNVQKNGENEHNGAMPMMTKQCWEFDDIQVCNYDDDDDDDDADDDNDIQVCVASDEHRREVAQLRLKDRQNLKNRLPTDLYSHQHCVLVSRWLYFKYNIFILI